MITSQSVNESSNDVQQKWPIYQEFLTHLADFFLCVYVYKCSVQGQNGSVIRNVHLSSGPFKWSTLYIYITYMLHLVKIEKIPPSHLYLVKNDKNVVTRFRIDLQEIVAIPLDTTIATLCQIQ